jgi:hypothetical protein
MMARTEHAGLQTKCPGCEAVVTIPGKGNATAVSTQRTQPKPPPLGAGPVARRRNDRARRGDDDFDDPVVEESGRARRGEDDFDDPEVDDFDDERPRKGKKKKKKKQKASMLPWILVSVGALLLLAGGTFGVWYFMGGGGGGGAELDFVPGNAQLFVHVQIGDMMKTELGKKGLDDIKALPQSPFAQMTRDTGLELSDFDKITAAFTNPDKEEGWVIITFTRAIDKQKLYSKEALKKKEATHEGKSYDTITVGLKTLGVYWVSDKMAVVGLEESVKKCIAMVGKRPSGLMDDSITRARGRHSLVVGVVPPPEAKQSRGRNPGMPGNMFNPDAFTQDLKSLTFILDYDNTTKLEAVGRFEAAATAQKLKETIDDGLKKAKEQFEGIKAFAPLMLPKAPGLTPQVIDNGFKIAKDALDSVRTSLSGADLSITASINMKGLTDLLEPFKKDALKQLGPGFGQGPGVPPGFGPDAGIGPAAGVGPGPGGGNKGAPIGGFDPLAAANRPKHENNLKQIALAMHMYADTHGGKLPPAIIRDAQGKALYSWRVELLPYLEHADLYNQFHKNEPWDSPANRKVLAQMPACFALPGARPGEQNTFYKVFVGQKAPWHGTGNDSPRIPASFPDGMSNTILVAEAATSVEWTKPEDIAVLEGQPVKGLFGTYVDSQKYFVAMADGSVKALPVTISEATLKNAINPADGNVLGPDWPK